MQFHGILSAVATPFAGDTLEIDEQRLRDLVDWTIGARVHGLVVGGSTGEFPRLSADERKVLLEVVIDQTAGRVPVIAHTGSLSTTESIRLTEHAQTHGAAGILAVSPFYERLSFPEVASFYRGVAGATSLPVIVYNVPGLTGVNLTPENIAELSASASNIEYVKDTSGDYHQVARLIHDYGDVVKTLVGWDTHLYAALLEGAAGTINGAANFLACQLVALAEAVETDDLAVARSTWNAIFPVLRFLLSGGYNTGVKGALDVLGASIGAPRGPISELDLTRRTELESILKVLDLNL
ncbi:dihydrodipicolinate synthase family protein [Nocardia sp. NPDC052254]|uniref:dihydrodipicolinate synthase family protein n=1 Tax=Nocardia sp. NPDC052254 TaxID=3155681 RepID=UPI0034138333